MSQSVMMPAKIGDYTFRGSIGEGAFSIVKLAYNEITQQYFACKIVPKTRLQHGNLQYRFEEEIRINQQIHHPGVVNIFDILKDNFNYYIMLEFCPNGELFQFIVDRTKLTEDESKPLIIQLLDTLHFIHQMNVAHRDLKPENVLIDKFGRLKISDFGLSSFLDSNGLVKTPCGSPCYASPECVSGKGPYNGVTNDIWSIGVISYAMMTGQLPWTKRNQAQLFNQIQNGQYKIPEFLSEEAQSFIRGLMTVDYTKRLTIPQALDHPFLKNTPRMNFPPLEPVPVISLRRVDAFFNKDIKNFNDSDIFRIVPCTISSSNLTTSFDKALKEITEKTPELVRRKTVAPLHFDLLKQDFLNHPETKEDFTETLTERPVNHRPIRFDSQLTMHKNNITKFPTYNSKLRFPQHGHRYSDVTGLDALELHKLATPVNVVLQAKQKMMEKQQIQDEALANRRKHMLLAGSTHPTTQIKKPTVKRAQV